MSIKDVMTHPPVTCRNDMHLDAVVRLMAEFECGMVQVVDAAGRLIGVITDRDVCLDLLKHGTALDALPVSDVLDAQVFSCGEQDRVESAAHMMRDLHISRVPVTDSGGCPVGEISIDDIARMTRHAKLSSMDREFVRTVAAMARPKTRFAAAV